MADITGNSMNRRSVLGRLSALAVAIGVGAVATPSTAYARFRIKYRPARVPKPHRAPRVTVAPRTNTRAYTARVSQIDRSMRALKVTGGTARTQMRNALANGAKNLRLGRDWNAHHVIHWKQRTHPTMIKAARGGFNINGPENGLRIPTKLHKQVHSAANDKKNIAQINKLMDDLHKTRPHYAAAQTATVVRNHARMWKYDTMGKEPLLQQFNREIVRKTPVNPIRLPQPVNTKKRA